MKIRIVATTDLHGSIFPTNYATSSQKLPHSLAHIASAIKKFRENETVILVDNGDAYQGTPLLTYSHQNPDNFENPIATVFNSLDYDFINLGNHDFNYGQSILKKYINEVKAPLLTSNVIIDNEKIGKTKIIEIEGKKIAFIGVVTHYIPHWERPDHISNIEFEDAFDTLKKEVEFVRSDVDYIVALYHGGLEKDPITGVNTERQTGENQGYRMLHEIEGIDILITGHQHRSISQIINGVAVTQTALKADEFASIELDLETGIATPNLHKTNGYEIDNSILTPLENIQNLTQEWLDIPLGSIDPSSPSLLIKDPFEARINKHPLVSFINQVQIDKSGADVASFALFNDAIGFDTSITMRDLVCTYLYPNTLVVKEMTGSQIKQMIEFSANYFRLNASGEIEVSPEFIAPKPQHYNYDMLDGLDYTINVSKDRGSRIEEVYFKGKPLQDNQVLKVVMNNYRAAGGGNYTMVSSAPTLQDIQEEMVDILMDYIKNNSPIKIVHKTNINLIAK